MNGDWLQLTEEDIARANRLSDSQSPMPDIIKIELQDLPSDELVVSQTTDGRILTITSEDLAPSAPVTTTTTDLRDLESMMLNLVNDARNEHLPRWIGTARLNWSEELAAVARGHSADMLRRQYVSHISPEGITAAQRIDNHGVRYVACGENIGVFYGRVAASSQAVFDIQNAFMNQPRSLTNHRGNLLNPIWTHIGIGISYNPEGSLVATQNFISAPGRRLRGR